MHTVRNYKGENLKNIRKQLSDPDFGTGKIDDYGDPEINWDKYITVKNDRGFDMRNKEDNGKYLKKIVLPKGTIILRYGSEYGYCTAPKGTPYERLALPYLKETLEYNEYCVIADGLIVECKVEKGIVAPSLDSAGGAIQYRHFEKIYRLLQKKVLKRIELWQ